MPNVTFGVRDAFESLQISIVRAVKDPDHVLPLTGPFPSVASNLYRSSCSGLQMERIYPVPLFQAKGKPIKFRIQRDLDDSIRKDLEQEIRVSSVLTQDLFSMLLSYMVIGSLEHVASARLTEEG